MKKNTLAITIGTLLEWAEFTFFAYMADDLSKIFFPTDDPKLARFKIYGVFASSYLVRPLGALILGHIGDRYGRKVPIIASLLLMSLATFSIGILPSYQSIGGLSPILLIIFRMIQGFAVGGEFNGATVLLVENNKQHPFLAGAWTPFASTAGMTFGSVMAVMVSTTHHDDLWRIPFLLSSFLAVIALYLRKDLPETAEFQEAKRKNDLFKYPILAAWKYDKIGLWITMVVAIFVSVFVYTGNIYYKTIVLNTGYLSSQQASLAITLGISLSMCLIPVFAHMADRFGGYKLLISGLMAAVLLSPVMIYLAGTGCLGLVLLGQMIYGLIDSVTSATVYTFLTSCFKTGTKYSGTSFAWSVIIAIFGGTTLMVDAYWVEYLNCPLGPGFYMSLSALLCLCTLIITRPRSRILCSNPYAKRS